MVMLPVAQEGRAMPGNPAGQTWFPHRDPSCIDTSLDGLCKLKQTCHELIATTTPQLRTAVSPSESTPATAFLCGCCVPCDTQSD